MPYMKRDETKDSLVRCRQGSHLTAIRDFGGRWRDMPDGPIWHYDPVCKLHQETLRHEAKRQNPALHVLHSRADALARKTHTTRQFILTDPTGPQWIRLLPLLEAFLQSHAGCISCGHPFDANRDTQIDHIHPPRPRPNGEVDWARHCARNIRILCGACNNSKGRQPDDEWVDQQYRYQMADAESAAQCPLPPATEWMLL